MVICIDSCVFIRGFSREDADTQQLLGLIGPKIQLVIPRLVTVEVTRNLAKRAQQMAFYRLFRNHEHAAIVDGPIPPVLLSRYLALGLSEKGDAYIGAFAEWMRVDTLISDNRHFLRELRTDAYRLLSPGDFLKRLEEEPSE
jgi:hypothetical protein